MGFWVQNVFVWCWLIRVKFKERRPRERKNLWTAAALWFCQPFQAFDCLASIEFVIALMFPFQFLQIQFTPCSICIPVFFFKVFQKASSSLSNSNSIQFDSIRRWFVFYLVEWFCCLMWKKESLGRPAPLIDTWTASRWTFKFVVLLAFLNAGVDCIQASFAQSNHPSDFRPSRDWKPLPNEATGPDRN